MRLWVLLAAMLALPAAAEDIPAAPTEAAAAPEEPSEDARLLARTVLDLSRGSYDTLDRLARIARRPGPCPKSLRNARRLLKKRRARQRKLVDQIAVLREQVHRRDLQTARLELQAEFTEVQERSEAQSDRVADSMASFRLRCPEQAPPFAQAMLGFMSDLEGI